jgi:hypothetical protein
MTRPLISNPSSPAATHSTRGWAVHLEAAHLGGRHPVAKHVAGTKNSHVESAVQSKVGSCDERPVPKSEGKDATQCESKCFQQCTNQTVTPHLIYPVLTFVFLVIPKSCYAICRYKSS